MKCIESFNGHDNECPIRNSTFVEEILEIGLKISNTLVFQLPIIIIRIIINILLLYFKVQLPN